jgi:hypothetical protein
MLFGTYRTLLTQRLTHTICNRSHKNICEESQKPTTQNKNQLIRDLFNQPEIGRILNRMWPEDLIRQAPENHRRMVPASDVHIHPFYYLLSLRITNKRPVQST